MIRYRLLLPLRPEWRAHPIPRKEVFVSLDVQHLDDVAKIHYQGHEPGFDVVRGAINAAGGPRAHGIDEDNCTAEDLAYAMRNRWLAPFEPVLLAGAEALTQRRPVPPEEQTETFARSLAGLLVDGLSRLGQNYTYPEQIALAALRDLDERWATWRAAYPSPADAAAALAGPLGAAIKKELADSRAPLASVVKAPPKPGEVPAVAQAIIEVFDGSAHDDMAVLGKALQARVERALGGNR